MTSNERDIQYPSGTVAFKRRTIPTGNENWVIPFGAGAVYPRHGRLSTARRMSC